MSLQAAIDFWHELLAADPLTTWEQFQSATQTDRLYFGTRPVCSVLRPHFLSPRAYSYLVEASRIVRGALGKAYDYLLTHDALRASLGVSSQEDALLALEPTRGPGDYSGRLDAFYLADAVPAAGQHPTLNFVEYNAESPGGLAFGESLSAIFRGLPLFAAFAQHYQVTSFAPRPRILHELLAGYRTWGGQGKPRIAIVDWRGVRTYREFELCQDYFRSQGYDVGIFDPDELEQAPDGRLTAGDFAIDLVYKRVVTLELLAKYGADASRRPTHRLHGEFLQRGAALQQRPLRSAQRQRLSARPQPGRAPGDSTPSALDATVGGWLHRGERPCRGSARLRRGQSRQPGHQTDE